jgi:hypothetical protein
MLQPFPSRSSAILLLISFHACFAWASPQHVRALDQPAAESIRKYVAASPQSKNRQASAVFAGDNVLPQLVDGAGWQTTFTFANVDTKAVTFEVYFIASNGNDLRIPIVGIGTSAAVTVTLPPTETVTIETQGTKNDLSQGYAYIIRGDYKDKIAGLAVFRQRVPGRPDFEAVVPLVSEFDKRFVLLYDNIGGFTTSMAIANPSLDNIDVDVTVRDEDANVLATGRISLGVLMHQAFTLTSRWPATANRRGIIEFRSTGWGASVLGLRFSPGGAFTSFHVMSNPDWFETGVVQ